MSQEKFYIRVIKINIAILLINTNILHFSLSKLTLNIVTLQCIRILQFFFLFLKFITGYTGVHPVLIKFKVN